MAAARRAITPATLMRYSIVPRLSLIGLQARARRLVEPGERRLVELAPDQRGRRPPATSTAVGATAPSTTRASVQTPPASSVTLTAGADHRNVHLGARNEAQIGVRRARRRAWAGETR